jgi:alpha-tubulin suppressor-like RCC1 family protein
LDDTGYLKHCGVIAGLDLSSQYEQRDFAKFKLVAAGKRNLVAVSEAYQVYFYGASKNNHYSTGTYETSNWYKAPWKTPLEAGESIVDISSGNHFTVLVTSQGYIYGCGEYIMNQINKQPHEGGDAKLTKLDLPEQYKALNVWCSKAKYS